MIARRRWYFHGRAPDCRSSKAAKQFRRVDEAIFTNPRKDAETDAWYQNPDQRTAFSPENFMELRDAE